MSLLGWSLLTHRSTHSLLSGNLSSESMSESPETSRDSISDENAAESSNPVDLEDQATCSNAKRARMNSDSDSDENSQSANSSTQNSRPQACHGTNDLVLHPEHSFKRERTKFHLLVAVTGSVATIKLKELVAEIVKQCPEGRICLRVVTTDSALHFFNPKELDVPVYEDRHEWQLWQKRGDPVLHIELRKWADALCIAPLDANTLAKIANGLCDNLLTCILRAWDPAKPVHFCPAMNTYMYEHPLTFKHLEVLKGLLQFREIPCVEKELMCGDTGQGAMAPVFMIASVIASEVKKKFAVVSRS